MSPNPSRAGPEEVWPTPLPPACPCIESCLRSVHIPSMGSSKSFCCTVFGCNLLCIETWCNSKRCLLGHCECIVSPTGIQRPFKCLPFSSFLFDIAVWCLMLLLLRGWEGRGGSRVSAGAGTAGHLLDQGGSLGVSQAGGTLPHVGWGGVPAPGEGDLPPRSRLNPRLGGPLKVSRGHLSPAGFSQGWVFPNFGGRIPTQQLDHAFHAPPAGPQEGPATTS